MKTDISLLTRKVSLFEEKVFSGLFPYLAKNHYYGSYNANHINLHGSELFSTYLAHDLDSLGMIRNE